MTTPTITPAEALAKVREALECFMADGYENCHRGDFELAKEALSLIPIIEGAVLPELPEGWHLEMLRENPAQTNGYQNGPKIRKTYTALIINGENELGETGNTPRAAVLAAIEKVKK